MELAFTLTPVGWFIAIVGAGLFGVIGAARRRGAVQLRVGDRRPRGLHRRDRGQ